MKKTIISSETIKVYRPEYADKSLPEVLGLYDPIDSRLYSFKDSQKDVSSNFEFLNYKINIEHKLTSAEVYVKLTEGCNFACPGCVTASDIIKPQDARHLKLETLDYLLEQVYRSANEKGFNKLKIKWAGGEPLLFVSYKLIRDIQNSIVTLSSKYNINTRQVVLTNGVYATSEKMEFFKKHDIQLSISLWGIKVIQEGARKPRNGQDSFDTIAKNICDVHLADVKYSVNHVVTPSNAKHFMSFLELMWDYESEKFIGYKENIKEPIPIYFAVFRPQQNVRIDYLDNFYKTTEIGVKEGFKYINSLINRGIKVQPLVRFDYLNFSEVSLTTCGTGYSYLAIGPDGITNCHENLYGMENSLELLTESNVFDLAAATFKSLEQDLVSLNNSDNTLLSLHGGLGCPRQRLVLGNSTIIEEFYTRITNDLLALEILRN